MCYNLYMKIKSLFLIPAVLAVIPYLVSAQTAVCESSKLLPVQFGNKSAAVKILQSCLITAGYKIPAGATGYYGSQTAKAVKDFYSAWYPNKWPGLKFGPLGTLTLKKYLSGSLGSVVSLSEDFKTFTSAQDFQNYFKRSAEELRGAGLGIGIVGGLSRDRAFLEALPSAQSTSGAVPPASAVERISETNVQVAGIDEPDIVKTNGREIYFSPTTAYIWWQGGRGGISVMPVMPETSIRVPPPNQQSTKIVKALPVSDLAIEGTLPKLGDLLLTGNNLSIFSGNEITGFDVSDPKNPVQKWNLKLQDNTTIVGSRLRGGKIYMVTKTYVSDTNPCPIVPFSLNGNIIPIPCYEIYHPTRILPADSTFNVLVLDAVSGMVQNKTSFVGSVNSSVIYMSPNYLYITYPSYESPFRIMTGAIKGKSQDLFPSAVIQNIGRLESYEISDAAKLLEFQTIIQNFENSLSADERLRIENELQNRLMDYTKLHKRDFDRTVLVKIGLDNLALAGQASVPGQPLNQFSLDEYNGNLRIATTIGNSGWGRGIGAAGASVNDVYVLDKDLKILGSVQGLGETEKIYSARFVEDKGYLVTFRQIDPFYVLDLSDPQNPALKGQLKIPGFSSYLHPITKDKILGVGQEGSAVKISLFDVADPANPVERDKYTLKEYWSEVNSTHHAFLIDRKYEVFFMPAGQAGYVFSYKDNKLSLVKSVADISAKRAVYVNDYLYIVGDNKISVLSEATWEKVKELDITAP